MTLSQSKTQNMSTKSSTFDLSACSPPTINVSGGSDYELKCHQSETQAYSASHNDQTDFIVEINTWKPAEFKPYRPLVTSVSNLWVT